MSEVFDATQAVSPRVCLFMACKERHTLCMNRESLDRVSCTSTTPWKADILRAKNNLRMRKEIMTWSSSQNGANETGC